METNIYELILRAQHEQKAMQNLLIKFDPLIKKFARKLDYEDAYYDLTVLFIEKITHLDCNRLKSNDDFTLLKYIKKIISSISCNLFQQEVRRSKLNTIVLPDEEDIWFTGNLSREDKHLWSEDDYPAILEDLLADILTDYQAKIIDYIVIKGYSVNHIAKIYGVTPEAITITKNRALKKLKKYFSLNT